MGLMLYRILCNGVQREDAKLSPDLASEFFCYVPLHKIWYGILLYYWDVETISILFGSGSLTTLISTHQLSHESIPWDGWCIAFRRKASDMILQPQRSTFERAPNHKRLSFDMMIGASVIWPIRPADEIYNAKLYYGISGAMEQISVLRESCKKYREHAFPPAFPA